jgi:hypothetical protein
MGSRQIDQLDMPVGEPVMTRVRGAVFGIGELIRS